MITQKKSIRLSNWIFFGFILFIKPKLYLKLRQARVVIKKLINNNFFAAFPLCCFNFYNINSGT